MAVECDTAAHRRPETSGRSRAHQNLCRKQFQVDALRVKRAGHGGGGVLGERARQDGVGEQKTSNECDSEAEDMYNAHRSLRALRPRNPY